MQKPVRVYTAEEVESEDKWQNFLNNESLKISDKKFEAVFLVAPLNPLRLNLKIITETKICDIHFSKD